MESLFLLGVLVTQKKAELSESPSCPSRIQDKALERKISLVCAGIRVLLHR